MCLNYIAINCLLRLEVSLAFLEFCSVTIADAKSITLVIIALDNGARLDMDVLVGNKFDGASTMSRLVWVYHPRCQELYSKANFSPPAESCSESCAHCWLQYNISDAQNFMGTL